LQPVGGHAKIESVVSVRWAMGVVVIVWLIGPTLAAIGLAGLLASWPTSWTTVRRVRGVFFAFVGVGLLAFASCCVCEVWDGSYRQAEYHITFQDLSGNPVEGIELRVEDREGRDYFHFPVDDYVPGKPPTSDRNGLLVFHHVSRPVELSGRTYYVLFVVPIQAPGPPTFICRFLYHGQEVYRVPFRDVTRWEVSADQVSTVKRYWQPPPWPEIEVKPDDGGNGWDDRVKALLDRNGNGRLDPEETAVFRSAERQAYEAESVKRHGVTRDAEIEFVLVRKTVTVTLPEAAKETKSPEGRRE
jgi:hypothetical protein